MEVADKLSEFYTHQYNDSMTVWRTSGAKGKARNIIELAKDLNPANVLEVGCGEGSILKWLSDWSFCTDMYGVDISQSGVNATKAKQIQNVKDIVLFDGYKIPYPDNHFDLVICSHVMEHVEHERVLLKEIKRVSRHQIFEVPIDFSFYVDKKLTHFLDYGHINIYTPALFRFLLGSEKFTIVKSKCSFYDLDVLRLSFKENASGLMKFRIKNFIVKSIPYLRGIKPNSYAVLTR
jgi:ubiquinone/menaquinone biosynthesis C-methylase UbiE